MTIAIIVVVAIIVIAVLYFIAKRNSIIAARNRVDESWSGIDVQLKRRHDLVPNLVETVKGYAEHESETFEKTTKARAEAMSAQSVGDTAKAEQQLTQAPGRPASRRRELPDPAGDRELPAAQPQPLRARGRDPGLAPDLQLQRPVLQHRHRTVPGLDRRQRRQLHRPRVLRDRGRRARAGRGQLRQIASRSRTSGHDRDDQEATLWICDSCGFIYDPAIGDPDGGIPPGTAFEDIPKDWFCPVCGARTSDFRPLEPGEA